MKKGKPKNKVTLSDYLKKKKKAEEESKKPFYLRKGVKA